MKNAEESEKYYIVNPKRCRDCVYGWKSYCTYILITGHRRPCPPGDECTVRITIKDARQRIRQRSFDGQFDKERPERPEKQLTRRMKTYWQEHPCTAAALKKAFPDCNLSRRKVQSYITRWRKHDQAQKEL